MADIIDVQNELVAVSAQALYPLGTAQPSAAAGVPVRIYPGWPISGALDEDLGAGTCHVSVFPLQLERNTSRFPKDWIDQAVSPTTLTLTVSGLTVTVGGAVSTPQNVMLSVGGQDYAYAVQATDTLTSIATALATLVPGASNSGPIITLASSSNMKAARVGAGGTVIRELRRQERVIKMTVWADSPAHRDAIAQIVDSAMAAIQFITLPDGFAARVIYRGSPVWDNQQKANLYRRDLDYMVEYATTQTAAATQITQQQINVTAQDGTAAQISIVNQLNL